MRVARRGAVGNHRHRLVGGMCRIGADLDVEHGGQAAQTLRADAERVDLVVELDAQLFNLGSRAARFQLRHVDRLHERFLRHEHRLFGGAADADAEHARRAPAGAHGRHGLQHPFDDGIGGIQHREFRLRLGAAALGGDVDLELVARHQLDADHRRRVVLGVLAAEVGFIEHRGAQLVVGIQVGPAHAFVDRVLERILEVETHAHADFQEDVDDARVLADRPVALGAHARVGEDLRDRVLRRRRLLALIGAAQGADVIGGMVVGDELQRVGDALDDVGPADQGHGKRFTVG